MSQSDKYNYSNNDFLERTEVFKEKKEEKLKALKEQAQRELTFKPEVYSTHDVAARYYERQLKKL